MDGAVLRCSPDGVTVIYSPATYSSRSGQAGGHGRAVTPRVLRPRVVPETRGERIDEVGLTAQVPGDGLETPTVPQYAAAKKIISAGAHVTHEHEPNAEAEGGPENDRSLPYAADAPVHATAEESDAPPWTQDEEKGPTARILVVQMGHCFRTSGATGTPGEQAFVKAVADVCAEELGKPGPPGRGLWHLRVINADEPLEKYAGDAFVAFHCDGSTNQNARGASVGYRNAAGQTLAQAWKHAYGQHGWSGGFRDDNYTENLKKYYGTRKAVEAGNQRAFIAECGFLTNRDDKALLTGPGGVSRVVRALFDALGI